MDDLGGTVSGKMQVLFPCAGGWNFFWTPKEGDHVVMSKLPNGSQEGYILGKVYTANKMPQGGALNIILIVSDDGKNFVRFDADNGTLDLVCDQDATLKFKNLDIEVKEHTHIKTKTLHVEVEESVQNDIGTDVTTVIGGNVNTAIGGSVSTQVDGSVIANVAGDIVEQAGGLHRNDGSVVHHN
jgi:phage baseplate assembly protein gpV